MKASIENLRIRFYGIQGSGSTFPSKRESQAFQEVMDYELLKRVFEDLETHISSDNRLDQSLEEYIGGAITKKNLLEYRNRFAINQPRIYGGWTTCIHIETGDGYDIVFDCGSGFRNCAKNLQSRWKDQKKRKLYILGSHSHSDHTEGFDQAAVCFDSRNSIHIYGNGQYLYALNSYLGIFSKFVPEETLGVQTPINFTNMPAKFFGTEIRDFSRYDGKKEEKPDWGLHDINDPIELGKTKITAFEVNHPAPCLAYKIEHNGKKVILCTDHELRCTDDRDDPKQKLSADSEARLIEHAMDADVLYRDGQYLRSEYKGLTGIGSSPPVSRLGWGHSCIEDVRDMAKKCRVKQTFVGHHDPNREWSERLHIDETLEQDCRHKKNKIELACAGTIIDL